MLPRTQRQKEILEYISSFIERHGYEPSYAQIARHFNVKSKATIAKHIAALERRGLLSRHHQDGAFGLDVSVQESTSDAVCEVRLSGQIAAGTPIDAVENSEPLCVPRFLLGRVRPDRVYALRVTGDSMINAGILNGDTVYGEIDFAVVNRTGPDLIPRKRRADCRHAGRSDPVTQLDHRFPAGRGRANWQSRIQLGAGHLALRFKHGFRVVRRARFHGREQRSYTRQRRVFPRRCRWHRTEGWRRDRRRSAKQDRKDFSGHEKLSRSRSLQGHHVEEGHDHFRWLSRPKRLLHDDERVAPFR